MFTNAELYKSTKELLTLTEAQAAELTYQVQSLNEKDDATRSNYESQLANLNSQITLYKDQIAGYERLLKRQRRKTFFTGAAGFITTGIAVYLFSQK